MPISAIVTATSTIDSSRTFGFAAPLTVAATCITFMAKPSAIRCRLDDPSRTPCRQLRFGVAVQQRGALRRCILLRGHRRWSLDPFTTPARAIRADTTLYPTRAFVLVDETTNSLRTDNRRRHLVALLSAEDDRDHAQRVAVSNSAARISAGLRFAGARPISIDTRENAPLSRAPRRPVFISTSRCRGAQASLFSAAFAAPSSRHPSAVYLNANCTPSTTSHPLRRMSRRRTFFAMPTLFVDGAFASPRAHRQHLTAL